MAQRHRVRSSLSRTLLTSAVLAAMTTLPSPTVTLPARHRR